jgi:hypothetical protein
LVDTIAFSGPFSWGRQADVPSVFDQRSPDAHGLYLWTVPQHDGKQMVYYVGETGRSFGTRMEEHLKEHLAGFYHLYDPDPFRTGTKKVVWEGHWDVDERRSVDEIVGNYPRLCETISSPVSLLLGFLRLREESQAEDRGGNRATSVQPGRDCRNFPRQGDQILSKNRRRRTDKGEG